MQAIIDFFASIGEVIISIVDFVLQLFKDLLFMMQMLSKFIVSIPSYLAWLPAGVTAVIIVIFSIVVIYKILGREG